MAVANSIHGLLTVMLTGEIFVIYAGQDDKPTAGHNSQVKRMA